MPERKREKVFPQFENIGKLKLTRNALEKKQLIFGIFAILTRREGNICKGKVRRQKSKRENEEKIN